MAGVLSAGGYPAATVAGVRRYQAVARRRPGWGERLEAVYIAGVVMLIALVLVYHAAHTALVEVIDPLEVARWGPALTLLALLGAGYWGTVQGPVVFSVADLGHLILGSPLPRRALVAGPLLRGVAAGAVTAAAAGGVAVIGLTGRGHTLAAGRAIDLVAGLAILGILAALISFVVSIDRRGERLLRLVTVPVIIGAGALILIGALAGRTGRDVGLWSGPWGWALQAAGSPTGWWIAATAGLALVVAVTGALVWRRRGGGESERYLRRSEGHARLQASAMDLNVRTALQGLGEVAGGPRRRRAAQLPRWRRWLSRRRPRARATDGGAQMASASGAIAAVLWRDLVFAAQRPEVLFQALLAGAAGTALALLDAGRLLGVVAAGVLLYVAAARLLDPLRIENDAPGRSRVFLGTRPGRAYLAHAALPAVFVSIVLAVTAVVLALSGALAEHGGAGVIDIVVAAPAIVGCAALSARRGGRIPQEMLLTAMSSDPSGGGAVLLGWLLLWPALAAALVVLPLGGASAAHGASGAWVVIDVAAAVILARMLARD